MTANIFIVFFNVFFSAISIWVAMYVNAKYLKPALLNKNRFTLYEIRDKLTILAMKGVVDEESEEYITLLILINNTIASTKSFRITRFLKIQAYIVTNKKLQTHLKSILDKIKSDKMPDEYKELVSHFFDISRTLYARKTKLIRRILSPLIFMMEMIRILKKWRIILQSQSERITKTEDALVNYSNNFAFKV
ncbi:MAG: hypothetical protein R8L53_04530 [Mariprofundales bacterium]